MLTVCSVSSRDKLPHLTITMTVPVLQETAGHHAPHHCSPHTQEEETQTQAHNNYNNYHNNYNNNYYQDHSRQLRSGVRLPVLRLLQQLCGQ